MARTKFENLLYVSESKIGVKKNGKYGFVNNKNGKIEIEIKYNEVESFENGRSKVRYLGKEFYIDTNGRHLN